MSTRPKTSQLAEVNLISQDASLKDVHYPESDGQPMAETDIHRDQMLDLIASLKAHYRHKPDVYVSGNLLLYYEEGNPRKSVAPDVFVVRGVGCHLRRTYLLWREGKGPDMVIELTSDSTRDEDRSKKHDLYEQVLKVSEYFLYDPTEDYLDPPFQGYRLEEGHYVPMAAVEGRLRSEELGLDLVVEGGELRLYDVATDERLLTPGEESATRRKAEAEVGRLRAELEALRQRLAGAGHHEAES